MMFLVSSNKPKRKRISMKLKTLGKNQTEVTLPSGSVVFFSYNTPVAARLAQGGFVRTSKKWSVTTSRHINQWLNGATAAEVAQEVLDSMA